MNHFKSVNVLRAIRIKSLFLWLSSVFGAVFSLRGSGNFSSGSGPRSRTTPQQTLYY